jgi:alpha-ketoglutarate-dependent taurine dioxygenase
MNSEIHRHLDRDGFVLLHGDMPNLETIIAVSRFGDPLTLPGLDTIQRLRPLEAKQSTPNTYSGNYGLDDFPLHTDMAHWVLPPRYLLLRCIVGSQGVATRILDGHNVIGKLGEGMLSRALVQPRRPLDNTRALLRLLDSRNGSKKLLRWDDLFITPATTSSAATCESFSLLTRSLEPHEIFLRSPGDTLLVDNWRMLHGRSRAGPEDSARHIERAYLDSLN